MDRFHIYESIGKGKHSVVYKGREKKIDSVLRGEIGGKVATSESFARSARVESD